MNWERIQANWNGLRTRVKSKWEKLSDEDLDFIAGNRDVLICFLQQRYKYQRERAELELDHFIHQLPSQ